MKKKRPGEERGKAKGRGKSLRETREGERHEDRGAQVKGERDSMTQYIKFIKRPNHSDMHYGKDPPFQMSRTFNIVEIIIKSRNSVNSYSLR